MNNTLYLLLLCQFLFSTTIYVPSSIAPTIQSAVNISTNGDTILVSSGTYTENIYVDRQLTILSVDGAESTIIDGNSGNGMEIKSDNPGTINGFTFQNCKDGIYFDFDHGDTDHEIVHCIFKNNTNGLSNNGSRTLHISNSLFYDNEIGYNEHYYGDDCYITNCTFDNTIDISFTPGYDTDAKLTIYNSILLGQVNGNHLNPVNLYYSN